MWLSPLFFLIRFKLSIGTRKKELSGAGLGAAGEDPRGEAGLWGWRDEAHLPGQDPRRREGHRRVRCERHRIAARFVNSCR